MSGALAVVTGNTYGPVIYVVAALLGGGLVPVVYQGYKNFRRGPIEDGAIIGRTVRDEMGNLKDLLAEYRLEVEVNKRQLEDYRQQLGTITMELAKAQARIGMLEDRLTEAKGEHDDLRRELEEAKARRAALQEERDRLAREAAELHARIEALEDKTGITEHIASAGHEPPD